ncbi:MAG: membrane protein insertion efficiency factor YidD [Candidatus Pacebacteria bacterium]|nr:membrane protein insertion efficiency factor YidD [Candidatus Paceibacterota bacterium]
MNPVIVLIRLYQRVFFLLRAVQIPGVVYTHCKFHPSCSEYAELAVAKYGIIKGSGKALVRIIKCNPFASGGVDYP